MSDGPLAAYLVKGDDPSLLAEAVKKLVDELIGDDDRSMAVEDLSGSGDEFDVGAVVDACRTPPFLSARRVVIVREAGRLRGEQTDALVSYLDDPSPTSSLVLVGGGGRIADALNKAVKAAGHVVDSSVGMGKARAGWLQGRMKDAPVKLDKGAADAVAAHLGEDVGRLPSILGALASAFGEGAKLSRDDVEPFLGAAGGVAPWDLTDAIDRRDTASALEHLHRLIRGAGRHPLELMATLHRHYGQMLRLDGSDAVDEQSAADLLGINRFPAGKSLRQSKALGSAGIFRAIELLHGADMALRGEGWPSGNDELVMEVLVARLSKLGSAVPAGRGGSRRR